MPTFCTPWAIGNKKNGQLFRWFGITYRDTKQGAL